MDDQSPLPSPQKPRMPFLPEALNSAILNHLPSRHEPTRRRRTKSKSKQGPPGVAHVSSLQRSFNLWDGIRSLQKHRWQISDIQYLFLAFLVVFSLAITPSAPALKIFAVLGSIWLLLMPATRQFLLPSSMIWIWLLYFFSSRFIPNEYRPHIWVRVLPALENVLYGANLSSILSAHQHPVLDILAWLPYGIIHFGAPAVCSLVMFIFGAPGTTPVFARTFGWMSILGVTIQLCFPCTPPWYENENGLVPAAYGMHGSPAGLARVDAIFGIDLYTSNFTNALLPFGAFPSLHAANAVLEALFMSHCFPQFRTLFIIYAGWVWWATMYLSHHYAIDLVGGGVIAAIFFYTARAHWLPQRQADKLTRWNYDYVEIGERVAPLDEEAGNYFSPNLVDLRRASSSSWTMDSSESWSSGSGTLSPSPSDGPTPGTFAMSSEGNGQTWHGASPSREIELHEVVTVR